MDRTEGQNKQQVGLINDKGRAAVPFFSFTDFIVVIFFQSIDPAWFCEPKFEKKRVTRSCINR